ncbi:MAG: SCO family protein [Puniceicoccaceae bacterium]
MRGIDEQVARSGWSFRPAGVIWSALVALGGVLVFGGCSEESSEALGSNGLIPLSAKSSQVELLGLDRADGRASIRNLKDGQESEVFLVGGDLVIYEAGQHLVGNVVNRGERPHLESVWPIGQADLARLQQSNKDLARMAATMSAHQVVMEGDLVPEFALVDHAGKAFAISDFRGRQLVMNFIFTRCGDVRMCPAANQRMVQLAEAVRADPEIAAPRFLVISFDPMVDNPGTLYQFAAGLGVVYPDFRFASGAPEVIANLLRAFGVRATEREGTIEHTMVTLLVDAGGRVQYRRDGSYWTLDEFLRRFDRAKVEGEG